MHSSSLEEKVVEVLEVGFGRFTGREKEERSVLDQKELLGDWDARTHP